MSTLERVNPDATRAYTRICRRCQCGRYIYPYKAPRRYAEGRCAACAGTYRDGATLVEDAAFLADHGYNLAGVTHQLNITEGALERALYRHGRGDLMRRLRRPR